MYPPRILHVVESLDHGSVENWLLRMLGHAYERGIALDWTFYCVVGEPGAMDEKARDLGARVIHSPVPIIKKLEFVHALRAELRKGRYDVLHCHHDLVSAVYLLAAMALPIKKLVHVHNADEEVPTANAIKRSIMRPLLRRACLVMADQIIGTSNHTLDTFIAHRGRRKGRDIVHFLGIDSIRFEVAREDRLGFRRKLGFAAGSRILLFAGRMVSEKNPVFAIDVLAEMRRLDPAIVGVFVGSGGLDQAVRQRGVEHRLGDAVRYLGWRDDVPEIMCCCDWFILPHPEYPAEGFGVAIVEAQLAGLRMLLSLGVLDDPLLPTASFCRLALSAGPKMWAEAAIDLLRRLPPSRAAALAALRESPFAMDTALRDLISLHR